MAQTVTEQISPLDWESTPTSVRNMLLSLEQERDAIRERLEQLENVQQAATDEHKQRIRRYQALVEQQFVSGLTPEQQQEIERLGEEIDAVNSAFYPSVSLLSETITATTGKRPE
jgi:chromosome segregation ATPase